MAAARRGDSRAIWFALRAYSSARHPDQSLDAMRVLQVDDAALKLQFEAQAIIYGKDYERLVGEAHLRLATALVLHSAQCDWRDGARDLHFLSDVRRKQERMHESADVANLAAELALRAGASADAALSVLGEAMVYSQIGEVSAADRAFERFTKMDVRTPNTRAWWNLEYGKHHANQIDSSLARANFEQALQIAEPLGLHSVLNAAHLNLARLEIDAGHLAEARGHFEAFDGAPTASSYLVSGLIARKKGDLVEAERLLAEALKHPHDEDYTWDIAYARGCVAEEQGNVEIAELHYREAIASVEIVREKMTELALRPAVLEHRRMPYEALFALYAAQGRKREALEIVNQLQARAWLDAAAAIDRDRIPSVKSPPIADVLAAMRDRDALVFVRAKSTLWRLYVSRGEVVELVALPALTSELRKWRSQPEDRSGATRLGAALLPASLIRAPDRPIYIVAQEPELVGLPFAALMRNGRYFVEDRQLVSLHGLTVASCRTSTKSYGSPVIVADSRRDEPLPAARDEASAIAALVGSVADLGAAASRARVLLARNARLLYAGVHARGGALRLSDGDLTAEDILAQGIAPQIAVLAGCATSDSETAEGWGALASSLLAAGTRTVVATSRPVEDRPTSLLMRAFFDAHGDTRPSAALAAAQRANLAMRTRDWASFAVWGAASPDDCQ